MILLESNRIQKWCKYRYFHWRLRYWQDQLAWRSCHSWNCYWQSIPCNHNRLFFGCNLGEQFEIGHFWFGAVEFWWQNQLRQSRYWYFAYSELRTWSVILCKTIWNKEVRIIWTNDSPWSVPGWSHHSNESLMIERESLAMGTDHQRHFYLQW